MFFFAAAIELVTQKFALRRIRFGRLLPFGRRSLIALRALFGCSTCISREMLQAFRPFVDEKRLLFGH